VSIEDAKDGCEAGLPPPELRWFKRELKQTVAQHRHFALQAEIQEADSLASQRTEESA
jgi:hypothetical protein